MKPSPKHLQIEKSQSAHALHDSVGGQFPFLKQIGLKLADLLGTESFRRAVEVLSKLLDGSDVSTCGSLGVITALEFVEHLFSELGHRDLLVTHIYLVDRTAANVRYA